MNDLAKNDNLMWAYLIHLGYNMWQEKDAPNGREYINASETLRFDKPVWDEVMSRLAAAGATTVVIDLGEGVQYKSHPEIASKGAWTVEKLREELARIRALGLQPIPKLNFSAAHDEWLGPYARCVSSDLYYQVCRDLIHEVIDLFDRPPLFHIGMDEETSNHQRNYLYALVRQGDLWWHDLFFYLEEIEKKGVRPWVWSDYIWNHPQLFLDRMPKSVLQSNWFYSSFFDGHPDNERYINAYRLLDEHGYEQVPTGSNWSKSNNFPDTIDFALEQLNKTRLRGFFQTVWKPTVYERKHRHFEAIDLIIEAKARYAQSK
ncbi:MAG: Tat pathway signal protein [Ruminococcaceae bacterium]|nr:Tat pathway signal protein [Oscillospiraceae bacterium]